MNEIASPPYGSLALAASDPKSIAIACPATAPLRSAADSKTGRAFTSTTTSTGFDDARLPSETTTRSAVVIPYTPSPGVHTIDSPAASEPPESVRSTPPLVIVPASAPSNWNTSASPSASVASEAASNAACEIVYDTPSVPAGKLATVPSSGAVFTTPIATIACAAASTSMRLYDSLVLLTLSSSSSPSKIVTPVSRMRSTNSAVVSRRPSTCSESCCRITATPAICGEAWLVPLIAVVLPVAPAPVVMPPGAKMSRSDACRWLKGVIRSAPVVYAVLLPW